MTMKKVISVMLSVLVIMASMVTISATSIEESIECKPIGYNITVTVKSNNSGTMTAQLFKPEDPEDPDDENILYGMDSSTPTGAGPYTYTFNFRMPATAVSGDYMVRVGNNISIEPETFYYANIAEKITFYEELNVKDESLIKDYLTNSVYKPVAEKMGIYNSLGDHALGLMNAMIYDLPLDPRIDEIDPSAPDYDDQVVEAVKEIEAYFIEEFKSAIVVADIADVEEESTWVEKATAALGDSRFDNKYYSAEDEETPPLMQVADVFACYSAAIANIDNLELANYQKAFDEATLLYVEQEMDAGKLGEVFCYYAGKYDSIFDEMTHINTLIAAEADGKLWEALKEKDDNTDMAALVKNAEDIARDLVGDLGGNGGGGGSTTPSKPSTPSIDKPTTPGPSTSIIDKPDDVNVPKFNDLSQAEWAKEAIEALAKEGIVAGKGNGAFAPNDNVTREEFVKMIVEAFDLLDEGAECNFTDVASDRWSAKYIASANRLGVVTGDGANFNPASQMARQDMAVIIYRVFELAGVDVDGNAIRFTDNGAISTYAKDAVSALSGAGIINGMGDGTFAPKATVTRAQAAKVIYGLLSLIGGDK